MQVKIRVFIRDTKEFLLVLVSLICLIGFCMFKYNRLLMSNYSILMELKDTYDELCRIA